MSVHKVALQKKKGLLHLLIYFRRQRLNSVQIMTKKWLKTEEKKSKVCIYLLSWIEAQNVNLPELETGRDITRCHGDDASTLCRGSCHCFGEALAVDTPIGANSRLFQQLVHCEQEDESASETGSDKNIQVLLLSPGVLFFHLYRPAQLCDTVHTNANANES